jgi:hypothetical protein
MAGVRAVRRVVLAGARLLAPTGVSWLAARVLLDDPAAPSHPDHLRRQLRRATDIALRPWR